MDQSVDAPNDLHFPELGLDDAMLFLLCMNYTGVEQGDWKT